jgi:energy-coupling factor transporter ATP-binding protein EcfA2
MDFYTIRTRTVKSGVFEIFPDFEVRRSKDLMVRGKSFYAIWDQDKGLWSKDEFDVQRLVDEDLFKAREEAEKTTDGTFRVRYMKEFSSGSWTSFRKYLLNMSDNYHLLDEHLTFSNDSVSKKDHVSRRLPYPLEAGSHDAWDEILNLIFIPEERRKIEWAIGAIVAGEAKDIQKFIVLYGQGGSGKSTILNIIQKLFEGYYAMFEAKALTSNNNSFSTEAFKGNPLVAIQHDGDLSRIEDNSKLNSIISHEEMVINEKFKPSYSAKANCFLFVGSNKPVKITDGKSGIIRRLIDVRTTGNTMSVRHYQNLISQIDFELGGIAHNCLEEYRKLGKNYYSYYRPVAMQMETDVFYNFVEANYYPFKTQEYVTLSQAYDMYKAYCEESSLEYKLPKYKFRDELRNYFEEFLDRTHLDGVQVRSIFKGFIESKFTSVETREEESPVSLTLDYEISLLDEVLKDCPAQYASSIEQVPSKKWINVNTTLEDINTSLLHYLKPPQNHIVIDFDLTDEKGEKSVEANLEAASKWPATYAEYSKSKKGLHLHYIYDGDTDRLSRIFSDGIEIKIFNGDASLRRQLSRCNNIPIAHINSGLPLKGEKVIDTKTVKTEKGLIDLITRNLNKEIHPGTKPSIDFIYKILDEAYSSGMKYDVTHLRPKVLLFANNSSHQPEYCVGLVSKMKFQSEEPEPKEEVISFKEEELVFYDVEVFPNLFIVCWKYKGPYSECVRMINPTSQDIEGLLNMKLIGFNNRRYDNHILYARYLGHDLHQLYELSQKILSKNPNAFFREAYNLSFADIYDFSSIKQSLKQFQVDLGITHKELGIPWDKPVPEEMWHLVAEYCDNDVVSEEMVFEDRKQDFVARQILAELSGLTINDTTQMHTAKIMFGNDPHPQEKFVYTDLSTVFPGYRFENGKSDYKGEDPGEGGYVYAEPGIYSDVALLDVASMHPASILAMNMFGKYTARYKELLDARIAIKHKDYQAAKLLLGGMLNKYLDDPLQADALAYALKIHALNIVYGLTSASFQNKFRDDRNIDNIVAKRGALFMIDLKEAVISRGFKVAHIKTDSIKIPNATKEIIEFVYDFGKKYGYTFEHEATYSKLCLVNKAVYIAKYADGKDAGKWVAVGAQFAHPYVFKTIFSKDKIVFDDLCETKAVTSPSALYLDMNEKLGEDEHNYQFVGKVGSFCPVKPKVGGGLLMREKEGKYYAATGTTGYRWMESEVVKSLKLEKKIDMSYFESLVLDAVNNISKFGDFELFISEG